MFFKDFTFLSIHLDYRRNLIKLFAKFLCAVSIIVIFKKIYIKTFRNGCAIFIANPSIVASVVKAFLAATHVVEMKI